jgi:glycosyltransferase involved in cell wall biosynthesis
MPDPFLSVVVPVYNVEAFLAPMIDSLAPLAAWAVEVIFVEDCSTDGSHARLVELLAASPLKSQVLRHDKNAGLSAARNTALTVASGTYVWFVDSDDTINPAELPAWFEKLETHDPDILLFDFANFEPGEVLEWSGGLPVARPADIVWRPVLRSTAPNRLQSGKSQK